MFLDYEITSMKLTYLFVFLHYRTYVSIEDANSTTRPLGNAKGTVKFERRESNPCVSISSVVGRGIEIMVCVNKETKQSH